MQDLQRIVAASASGTLTPKESSTMEKAPSSTVPDTNKMDQNLEMLRQHLSNMAADVDSSLDPVTESSKKPENSQAEFAAQVEKMSKSQTSGAGSISSSPSPPRERGMPGQNSWNRGDSWMNDSLYDRNF